MAIQGEVETFTLTGKELATVQRWRDAHPCPAWDERGHIRQRFSYTFYSGGLGVAVTVRCVLCGEELRATDFASW